MSSVAEKKVRRLITERDLAGRSRIGSDFPLYHDPIVQLAAALTAFLFSLLWSMIVGGIAQRMSQALVLGSSVLVLGILARSVRNGWNLSVYRQARRATQREAALRAERDALREVSLRCAALSRHGSTKEALKALQALTEETQRALRQSLAGGVSLAIAEEGEEQFFILCVAGRLSRKIDRSCRADRAFPELLKSLAPRERVITKEVLGERRYWIGLVTTDTTSDIDSGALETIGAWISLLDELLQQMPRKKHHLQRVA
jgi:type II secretory pathway pseudopilin PulG